MFVVVLAFLFLLTPAVAPAKTEDTLSAKALVGRMLFFDPNLSKNRTQSCATCHNPDHAFIDNRDNGVGGAASLGDDGKSIGDRNAPTAAYAFLAPEFHYDKKKKQYIGGQFWDGREKNLRGQAGGPPLNPGEMAMESKEKVVAELKKNPVYRKHFREIFGPLIFSDVEQAYDAMAECLASFEKTEFFSPFDSKYDRYLRGEYQMTEQEELGMALFFSNNNTNCATCHMAKSTGAKREPFSNYEYHNIGTPVNQALRKVNGMPHTFVDHGLLNHPDVHDQSQDGKFKVPTLRNVAVTGPYMHNGVFRDLETVIAFYDKYNNSERKLNPETGKSWRAAEIAATINHESLKAKRLSDAKIAALVAFLKTLTDKRYEHLLDPETPEAKVSSP